MVRFYGYIVCDFEVIDRFQYGKALSNGVHANFFEIFMIKVTENFPCYAMLCGHHLARYAKDGMEASPWICDSYWE